jgi:hypothetical protein
MHSEELGEFPEWRNRLMVSLEPGISDYWHEQVRLFLYHRKTFDTEPSLAPHHDPWDYIREYPDVDFYPESHLPAAFVAIGDLFSSCRPPSHWFPPEVKKVYPFFFTGNNAAKLPLRDMNALLEILWEAIEQDLKRQGFRNDFTSHGASDSRQIRMPVGEVAGGPLNSLEKVAVWEDILPQYQAAIQKYMKESAEFKANGKRLMIETFCIDNQLVEKTFRSEYDKVKTRRKRQR